MNWGRIGKIAGTMALDPTGSATTGLSAYEAIKRYGSRGGAPGSTPVASPSSAPGASAPPQNVLSYDASKRAANPLASSVSDYYRNRMAGGGITDATRAKWAEMDDATGAAAAQARMNQAQPGMFGQGRASRAMAGTDQTIMQQVAANKLKQAQMAGDDQAQGVSAAAAFQQAQDANARADREQALRTAEAMGDTVTMAGLNQQALGQQGYGYTDYGSRQLQEQAAQQKADADWAKRQQMESWDLSKRSNEEAMRQAQDAADNDIMGVTKRMSNPTNWGRMLKNIF